MDVGVITAIIGGIVSIITGAIGYASGRGNNKMTDRELLSKDEQAFRAELREELAKNKEEIKRLSEEIQTLREENLDLITENRLLNARVEELVSRWGGELLV
ncbi:hypothetical protein [Paenibacillus arenosi]|uniref:Uncharacterized protein n=1 Tax=Paenibacillus arenosi TaxID=2774142 RepID=A0ABR9AXK6_9BACL|nr:hypothetical protein [Paenibacillus arenosi]MBD8498871.1 hypothetical protein [Paenibacillus arenosi]